ncbi:sialidase family protein [Ideonella sp.]|uniref:sialidase family protein n=1 Tax=Ideonella sp. TaxID=1929293 RepID=UPI0035B2F90A
MRTLPRLSICLSVLALALAASPAWAAKRVSTDPFTNTDSQHATEVEPDTFAFGSTVVGAFQTGRFFDGGSSDIGFATSQDRGKTWVHGFLPSITVNSTPAGPYDRVSDPSVAYDAKHGAWLILSLPLNGGSGKAVVVSRSTDGGLNWSAPVTVSTTTGFYDKTWIACDNTKTSPHYGHCYATWDDANAGDLLLTSTSTDGGLSWGAKKTTANNAAGLGGQPLAQPNGDVVVPVLSAFADRILAYKSTNGGTSWRSSTTVATISDHGVAGNLRTEPLPSAEVDAAGKVYVVWHDCRFRSGCASNDIVMSTSTNGTTWTSPVRIPIDPTSSTVDHFIPGLAVDRNSSGSTARLALTYYFYPSANCTQSTCKLSVGFVSSVDGGTSWSAAQTLAGPMTMSDLADTSQGLMVGDYISTSFAGAKAVPIFAIAKAKSGSAFDEAMYASKLLVTALQPRPLRVTDEPVLSLQGDRVRRSHPLVTP